jgi:hypothetical protein
VPGAGVYALRREFSEGSLKAVGGAFVRQKRFTSRSEEHFEGMSGGVTTIESYKRSAFVRSTPKFTFNRTKKL